MMKYNPTIMDELNKAKAHSLQPTLEDTALSLGVLFVLVVFGTFCVVSQMPILWISYMVIFGYYLWWSKHQGRDKDPSRQMDRAFESYYRYAVQREIDYYSVCSGHQVRACKKLIWSAVIPPMFEPKPKDNDPWEFEYISVNRLLPENYVSILPNDVYDYTQYFVEIAYRFMVACYRLNIGEPKICNFYETLAKHLWGIEQTRYEEQTSLPYSPHIPFIKYPIDPVQQFEICHFDYRQVDHKYGWTWKVWRMAEERFNNEKHQHEIRPYHSSVLSEFNRISRMQLIWEGGNTDATFIIQQRMMREEFSKVWLKK